MLLVKVEVVDGAAVDEKVELVEVAPVVEVAAEVVVKEEVVEVFFAG